MKLKSNRLFDEATDGTALGDSTGSAAVASEDTGSDVNWDKLDTEFDRLNDATEENPFVADPAPVETPPVTEPVVAPTAPQVPAPVQPTAPVAPVVEATPQPQAPVQPEVPQQPQVDRAAQRQQYVSQLETAYAMSDEDAQRMITEPEAVIPKLAARLHVDIVDTVIAAVMGNLPNAINAIQSQGKASSEAEDAFFQAWPQLKNAAYQKTVYDSVAAFRALNPRAPRDEVVRAAGLQALIQLRLPIPPELLQQPSAPATPASFTPAAPGAGGVPMSPQGDQNPFVKLSQEFLLDD